MWHDIFCCSVYRNRADQLLASIRWGLVPAACNCRCVQAESFQGHSASQAVHFKRGFGAGRMVQRFPHAKLLMDLTQKSKGKSILAFQPARKSAWKCSRRRRCESSRISPLSTTSWQKLCGASAEISTSFTPSVEKNLCWAQPAKEVGIYIRLTGGFQKRIAIPNTHEGVSLERRWRRTLFLNMRTAPHGNMRKASRKGIHSRKLCGRMYRYLCIHV